MKIKNVLLFATALALAIPSTASAQRWRVFAPRACSGGSCSARYQSAFQASYRATYGFESYAAAPCQAVETVKACEPVQSVPEPCAPVYESYAPAPCQPVETVLTPPVGSASPEPCAPVESTTRDEYAPFKVSGGAVRKVSVCPNGACPLTSAARSVVSSLLSACNGARARYGVASLTRDVELEAGALAQAKYCASVGALVHGGGVAEIIAMNTGAGGAGAISQWLNSPAHRALLLSRGYTRAGAASFTDSRGETYYVVRFR